MLCENDDQAISFMFPVLGGRMGGVQMLLINIIPFLISSGCKVRLYDYQNGVVKNSLDKLGIEGYEFISLNPTSLKIKNKGNEVFVLTDFLWVVYPYYFETKDTVRLLMWDVYYPTWDTFHKIKMFKIPNLKSNVLKLLSEKNAVIFMEKFGAEQLEKAGFSSQGLNEKIVPVPIIVKKNEYIEKFNKLRILPSAISIGYIGRATDWKIYPVKKLIIDLSKIKSKNFKLVVYTDDAKHFNETLPSSQNVEIIFKLNLWGEILNVDILKNIDLGFSMGTSALEFAKLGVPTLLADFDTDDFPEDYRYRFLHNAENGNLGMRASDKRVYLQARMPLVELLEEYNPISESVKCFRYCIDNHEISTVAKKIIIATNATQLKPVHLNKLGMIYRMRILHYLEFIRRRAIPSFWDN